MGKPNRSSMRLYLYHIQGGKCHYCSHQMTKQANVGRYFATEDHVVTRSQGGGHGLGNLVGACFTCNNMRGKIPYHYFKQYIAMHGNEEKISSVLKNLTREQYERHKTMYDAVRTGFYHLDVDHVHPEQTRPMFPVAAPPPPPIQIEPFFRRAYLHKTRRKMQSILIGIPLRVRREILKEEQ